MPDISERVSPLPEKESQSINWSPYPGMSRLDQILSGGTSKIPELDRHSAPPVAKPGELPVKPGNLRSSIYTSPFQLPAGGDGGKNRTDQTPAPFIPAPPDTADTGKTRPGYQPAPFVPVPPANTDAVKPQPGYQPGPFMPSPFPSPDRQDSAVKPVEPPRPDLPILIPPIGDIINKPADRPATIAPGPDGKIEISEKDFERIGPKARQVLTDAGVTRLTIKPGQGFDTYEAYLKKSMEIAQDPNVDGTRKITMATHFKADVSKNSDGTLTLDNIQGLTAESKIILRFREAQVDRIQLRQTADGKSEIISTGSWNGMSSTKTRIQPAEVFEKANILFERMQKIKGQ
jgi:hypothetical protein